MNAKNYELWSQYYDPENIEMQEINQVLQNHCDIENPWIGKRVLEIGCGTGRFTRKIINMVQHVDAIDPDKERTLLLESYLDSNNLQNKCTIFNDTLDEYLRKYSASYKYDVIIFSWSWAFLPENERKTSIDKILSILNEDGVVISTMVEAGQCEEIAYDICRRKNPNFQNVLEKNIVANETLRKILIAKPVFVCETIIDTYFQFDTCERMNEIMCISLPDTEQIELSDVVSYFTQHPIIQDSDGKYNISDVVRCIVFKRIPANESRAKITFNYKLCDNKGGCSAAKECAKYRSAIIRVKDDSQPSSDASRWGILTDRCNPEVCGKKCESICELFQIHRFWPEVYESIRTIENTAIEPDFFDKDRYGSDSYNPAHRITDFEVACSCLDPGKPLQILEISDERRHASSFDSILITDIIPRTYYDRYFTKYDVPKMENLDSNQFPLYEDDSKYNDIYKAVFDKFQIDELPVFLIISHGKIVFKHEGLVRKVDADVVNGLREKIANVLNQLD